MEIIIYFQAFKIDNDSNLIINNETINFNVIDTRGPKLTFYNDSLIELPVLSNDTLRDLLENINNQFYNKFYIDNNIIKFLKYNNDILFEISGIKIKMLLIIKLFLHYQMKH